VSPAAPAPKIPVSVLVVIHTPQLEVLLLERCDYPDYWQSVTGSLDDLKEQPIQAAQREALEETGLDSRLYQLTDWHWQNDYEIYEHWRHRYAPGVTRNIEHVFGLCVPQRLPIRLAPREHRSFLWLPWEAAAEKCFSGSNAAMIRQLPQRH
jgi:dATP pyrophosphohydrolase